MSAPWRVLLVDDVEGLRYAHKLILRRHGGNAYQVVAEAGDGQDAIEKAKEHVPDLVLLDVSMPVMDGLEALPKIRELLPHAIIIMVSGFEAERLEALAKKRGADGYLEKGLDPSAFATALAGILAVARRTRRPALEVQAAFVADDADEGLHHVRR